MTGTFFYLNNLFCHKLHVQLLVSSSHVPPWSTSQVFSQLIELFRFISHHPPHPVEIDPEQSPPTGPHPDILQRVLHDQLQVETPLPHHLPVLLPPQQKLQ